MDVNELKRTQLEKVAEHREKLRRSPKLRWLFFELTSRCNLSCAHCGSRCSGEGSSLTVTDVERSMQSVAELDPMICLTGGEPMLHPDFYEIAGMVHRMGFCWGITTNATLIDEEAAEKLKQAGMGSVSVSLDGMEKAHDALRQRKGAWQSAVRGLKALMKAGIEPQVTTVLHPDNFEELESLYLFLKELGIKSWRPINVEPIGRACESKGLLLSAAQIRELLSYIQRKRYDQSCPMEVTFGCSHYLGVDHERMVRDHYFLCGAGILTASVRSNGDICACLDIENLPELVQGNIRSDDLKSVWENGFDAFRRDRTKDCSRCLSCSERFICGGDSAHTWDFVKKQPMLCYRDLFDSETQ